MRTQVGEIGPEPLLRLDLHFFSSAFTFGGHPRLRFPGSHVRAREIGGGVRWEDTEY